MRRAIREHLRDFVAIGVLVVAALVTTGIILGSQTTLLPSWVPFIGDDKFELKAEFSSAQAVTPGQGQTVTIAGINVGQVSGSELDSGRAIVTMQVDHKYAELIHPDATLLLRPRTGLQDMTIQVDPGADGEPVEEGTTLPLASSQPNVQPDQIFASLDGDTRSFLQLLLEAAGKGLEGDNGRKLAAGLKRFYPFARDLAKINGALAERRENIKRAITNFGLLSRELGHQDTRLAEFVTSSNDALGAFARQEASLRELLRELPGALSETRKALVSGDRFAKVLGPGSRRLIPAAQALGPALEQVRPLFRNTVGPIRDQIRPFARDVQKPLRQVKRLGEPLADTSTQLAKSFDELNRFFNALAYNPPGSEEGYLFWASWLNHNTNALFFTQDAGGPLRHGLVLLSCYTSFVAESVTAGDLDLTTLSQLSGVPTMDKLNADAPPCTF